MRFMGSATKKKVSNIFNGSNELCLCAFDGRCYIFIPITGAIALSYLGRFSLHLALDRAILITVKHSERISKSIFLTNKIPSKH